MAQWRNLEELSRTNKAVSERIDLIYNNESFVFKIRTLCADFIEKDNWVDSNSSDGSIQQDWFGGLLESLEDMGQCGDLKHKMSVKHDTQALKAMSEDEAYSFVQMMKHCIKQEQQLIQSFLCQPDDRRASTQNVATENVKITAEMDQSAQALMSLEQKVNALVKEQENFNVFLAESTAKIEELRGQTTSAAVLELRQLEEEKTALILNLYQNHRQIVAERLEELDGPLGLLLDNVWADIDAWKKQQLLQITGLAKPPDRIMDVLGQMCERVGELLCTAQRLAEHVLNIYKNLLFQNDTLVAKVTEVANRLDARLQKHVVKIFVVDRPPPQIIKVVNTKSGVFSMAVRLLGAASLGLPGTIKVTAELFREKDVETAMAGDQVAGMCQVVNGKDKIMEISKTPMSGCSTKTGTLVANFTKVCLEKAQRTERSRDDLVTDNKYLMVFYTQVVLHNKPMQLVTHSLPIILISHVLQDCTARATLVWNTAFPLENGRPFEEEKEVCWARVAEVLDALFYVNTERHLTPEQLTYLATIAFRKRDENTNFSEMMISRAKLLKDHLHKANNKKENPSRNFPFWKWFYANMNLLKERLKREWKDGIIYGFVSKANATRLLTDQPDGTFLLRFSESSIEASMKADICGCITVAVTTPNPQTGEPDVFHVKDHLATKDIVNSSLAQILDSFEFDDAMGRKQRLLHYLWPNRLLEEVFKAYLPQRENKDDPYKQGRVTITILLCSDESRLRRGSQAMSPRSVVSDLDDMSTIASPGSVISVQSPGVAVPTPSNVVTISDLNMFQNIVPAVGTNAHVFVPDRLQAQLPDLNTFNMDAFLQYDQNGDVMLSPDFQLDSVTAMDS